MRQPRLRPEAGGRPGAAVGSSRRAFGDRSRPRSSLPRARSAAVSRRLGDRLRARPEPGGRGSMKRAGTPLVAAAAVAIVLFGLAATAGAHPVTGRIIPHVFVGGQAPPTTSQCETNIGIECYGPIQLQKAYDMNPLYARADGKGQTIVIVDSFGSPTLARPQDLRHRLRPARPALAQDHPAGRPGAAVRRTNETWRGWACRDHARRRVRARRWRPAPTSCSSRRRWRRPRA